MVSSDFILINKNGRRTLLNTAQITSVYDMDMLLTKAVRRVYWEYPLEQEMAYLIRVGQPEGYLDFLFTDATERDQLLDRLIAAISPGTTLDSVPGLPYTWPELARTAAAPKHVLNGKEYATEEAYWKAWDEWSYQEALAVVMAQTPTSPTPKPPRKSRTRRQ